MNSEKNFMSFVGVFNKVSANLFLRIANRSERKSAHWPGSFIQAIFLGLIASIAIISFNASAAPYLLLQDNVDGFHDGNSGSQIIGNCTAFGWAKDNDNTSYRVSVRAMTDYGHAGSYTTQIGSTTANQYRSDLTGVCAGGNCSYGMDLRFTAPVINAAFNVQIQALSIEGHWVKLNNSPKTLTCTDTSVPAVPVYDSNSAGVANGGWFNGQTLTFNWHGTNNTSGIDFYNIYWGTSSSGTGTTQINVTPTNTYASWTSSTHSQTGPWYFRARTHSRDGQYSAWTTLLTYSYDQTAPSNPTSISESHGAMSNSWQSTISSPTLTWSGAVDSGGSGVAGYYVYWGIDSFGTSGSYQTSTSFAPGTVSPGIYYLRIQTKDIARNTTAWATLFTFKYETTPPANPTSISESHGLSTDTWQSTVGSPSLTWSGASDTGGSGVAGYNVYWGYDPTGTAGIYQTSTSYAPGMVKSGTYYLRVQTKDDAGNTSSWITLFIFKYAPASLALGDGYSCALAPNLGGVKCWGVNDTGQLGDGTTTQRLIPAPVSGLTSGVIAITSGMSYTCALTSSGEVMCWGGGERLRPVQVTGLPNNVSAIAAGWWHTCAMTSDGKVLCWGANDSGQLGDGTTINRLTPVVAISSGAIGIAAGGNYTCAVTRYYGGIKCWGSNDHGQLGDGTTTQRLSPVLVSGLTSGVIAIAAGYDHTCALVSYGGYCWGNNSYGQLGDGNYSNSQLTPVSVIGLTSGVIAITAGNDYTCALTNSVAKCWGDNQKGQLGDGTTITAHAAPVVVSGLSNAASSIATGYRHTCAVTSSLGVQCWGDNWYGQLGDGTTTQRLTPVPVVGLTSGISAIEAGSIHTCALSSEGQVLCWGDNELGQLGNNAASRQLTPVVVSGLSGGVMAIAGGGSHTCAITSGNGMFCWGFNGEGQLGVGTTDTQLPPTPVVGLSEGVIAVATGYQHTCALTSNGEVLCWGANWDGQLGDGTTDYHNTPTAVVGLPDGVVAITAGLNHTCALTSEGEALCWGGNWYGQLGDGTTDTQLLPTPVVGLPEGVIAITAGYEHNCALTANGEVLCWGSNMNGQLGDGTYDQQQTPVAVNGLSRGAVSIVAGSSHTCALNSVGGVQCWGDNDYGQLGDSTTVERLAPVPVSGLPSGAVAITAGEYHTCALISDGGVLCWGANDSGELGDGTSYSVPYPTAPLLALDDTAPTNPVSIIESHGIVTNTWQNSISRPVFTWSGASDGAGSGILGYHVYWGPDPAGTSTSLYTATSFAPFASSATSYLRIQTLDRMNNSSIWATLFIYKYAPADLALGNGYSCALAPNAGGIKCWGNLWYGQLGDGTTNQQLIPKPVNGLTSGVAAITTGNAHICVITNDGGVYCWGDNSYGQLGDGTTDPQLIPKPVNELTSGVVAIASGEDHTCALTSGGEVYCWGDNSYGQLGDGTKDQRLTPMIVDGLTSGVVAISVGKYHSCALNSNGEVLCWGDNDSGQLGDGSTDEHLTPVLASRLPNGVVAIAAGGFHTCAMVSTGTLQCWGANWYGQLGDGTTDQQLTPVTVSGLFDGVAAVAAGTYYTCALTNSGRMFCWGDNTYGQLGDGTTTQRLVPAEVDSVNEVSLISTGSSHTCALSNGSGLQCWGSNWQGELGVGITGQHSSPVVVSALVSGTKTVAAGVSHTCAVTSSGGVQCWGENWYGQLGDGTKNEQKAPVSVVGLTGEIGSISIGEYHTCALTTNGEVYCWGANSSGQLGNGTIVDNITPVAVMGLPNGVTSISTGYEHTCALTANGEVLCWGGNWYGQLGDGTTTQRLTPVPVVGLPSDVVAISAGRDNTCALTSSDEVLCWGNNTSGKLGDGTTTQRLTPVPVIGLPSGVIAIATGWRHTCALTSGNGVLCWGNNYFGQLGDGTITQRLSPAPVTGLPSGVIAITTERDHTCALTNGNEVLCWGNNNYGELGDGTMDQQNSPVVVGGLVDGAKAISAGESHTCALNHLGGVLCWGNNDYGQLGDGTSYSVPYPTDPLLVFDDTPPTNPTSVSEREGIATDTWQSSVSKPVFTWSGASDGDGSGILGYHVYWGPDPAGTSTSIYAVVPINLSASAGTNYLRVQTLDRAGNSSAWITLFLFNSAWTAEGNKASAYFGESISSANVNGDSYDDLLVGAPSYDGKGALFVYLGSADGLSSTPQIIQGANPGDHFGWSVSSAGDVNGDHIDDVIVGAIGCGHSELQEGCAYVYYGSNQGLVTTPAWSTESNQANAAYGYVVGSAGDVNGDGISDVFVGAPNFTNGETNEGKVFVYYGSLSGGLRSTPSWEKEGGQANAYFGLSASAAGRVNGDNIDDLIIGAPNASDNHPGEGKAYIFFGSTNGLADAAGWTAVGGQENAHFGEAVAAGDITGDGRKDIAVGAPDYDHGETDEGAVFVYLNSVDGLSLQSNWMGEANQSGANYGLSVSLAGDVDHNGRKDLLIGSSRFSNSLKNVGKVYLYYGASDGVDGTRSWVEEGNQEFANYGYVVAFIGDVNGDGHDDFSVGAALWNHTFDDEGRAILFFGK